MSLEGAVTGTFGDYSETNSEATTVPSNYEICQRSGFKVKPENLVRQWDGLWVRKDLRERRHPQDFVRPVPEHVRGSSRPERPDSFVGISGLLLTEDGAFLTQEADGFFQTEAITISAADL